MNKYTLLRRPFRPGLLCVLISVILATSFCIYLFFTHRIRSFIELVEFIRVALISQHDDQCRIDHFSYSSDALRCLPNVLFLGASKCGTTSMTGYLNQHPLVYFTNRFVHQNGMATQKHNDEIHLFDRRLFPYAFPWIEQNTEYASSPPIPIDLKNPPNWKSSSLSAVAVFPIVMHYTPQYIYAPTVPFEIETVYPSSTIQNMKYIIMLRDPIERALSSYWYKSSHLFTTSHQDTGSLDDFKKITIEEISLRRKYDACMKLHHDKYKPYFIQNHSIIQPSMKEITTNKNLPTSNLTSAITATITNNSSVTTITTTTTSFTLNHQNDNDEEEKEEEMNNDNYDDDGDDDDKNNNDKNNNDNNNNNNDDDEMAWIEFIEAISHSHDSTMIQFYQNIKQTEFHALNHCFGADMFRAKSLGLRHIDKGIYIDQIERWFLNHPRKYDDDDDDKVAKPKYKQQQYESSSSSSSSVNDNNHNNSHNNYNNNHDNQWRRGHHRYSQNYFIMTIEEFEAEPEKWYHRLLAFLGIGDTAEIVTITSSSTGANANVNANVVDNHITSSSLSSSVNADHHDDDDALNNNRRRSNSNNNNNDRMNQNHNNNHDSSNTITNNNNSNNNSINNSNYIDDNNNHHANGAAKKVSMVDNVMSNIHRHIYTTDASSASTTVIDKIIIDFTQKRLERPNKLSSVDSISSSSSSSSSSSNHNNNNSNISASKTNNNDTSADTTRSSSGNKNQRESHASRLDPEFKAMLMEFYHPYNRRLEKLLGRSMNWGY